MSKNIFILLFIFGNLTSSFAQSTPWRLKLSSGDTLFNNVLIKICGDSLNIIRDGESQWIKVASIIEARFIKKSEVWKTAKQYAYYVGIGAVCISAVVIAIIAKGSPGFFLGNDTNAKIYGVLIGAPIFGALFIAIGGVVGGIVAIAEGGDRVYDFSQMKLREKLTTLHSILENQ